MRICRADACVGPGQTPGGGPRTAHHIGVCEGGQQYPTSLLDTRIQLVAEFAQTHAEVSGASWCASPPRARHRMTGASLHRAGTGVYKG